MDEGRPSPSATGLRRKHCSTQATQDSQDQVLARAGKDRSVPERGPFCLEFFFQCPPHFLAPPLGCLPVALGTLLSPQHRCPGLPGVGTPADDLWLPLLPSTASRWHRAGLNCPLLCSWTFLALPSGSALSPDLHWFPVGSVGQQAV